jgi:hypothetical protein
VRTDFAVKKRKSSGNKMLCKTEADCTPGLCKETLNHNICRTLPRSDNKLTRQSSSEPYILKFSIIPSQTCIVENNLQIGPINIWEHS